VLQLLQLLQFVLNVILLPLLNGLHFYISSFRGMCAVLFSLIPWIRASGYAV